MKRFADWMRERQRQAEFDAHRKYLGVLDNPINWPLLCFVCLGTAVLVMAMLSWAK